MKENKIKANSFFKFFKRVKPFYLEQRFFWAGFFVVGLFALGFPFPFLFTLAKVILALLFALLIVDIWYLSSNHKSLRAERIVPERLSLGDQNLVTLNLESFFPHTIYFKIIDELPIPFQAPQNGLEIKLPPRTPKTLSYYIRPVHRGEFQFGRFLVFAKSMFGLLAYRFTFDEGVTVKVYPSYIQLKKYDLLAISNHLKELGIRKIRQPGHNKDFDHIRHYVQGDERRFINWKASARKNELMVNHYEEEKGQEIFALIDKGRAMKMPFENMSLLDYAINATLVLSNIVIKKQDKAGVITFNSKIEELMAPSRSPSQMVKITELLYNQDTQFQESGFDVILPQILQITRKRSLLILFTNFEHHAQMERQIPFLKQLSRNHVLVVIFFKNTELEELALAPASTVQDIYRKTIAKKLLREKQQIVKSLNALGIFTVLTKPKDLTLDTINKYLLLKSQGVI